MRLEWLELRDFRNHQRTAVDHLVDGLIVVVGPNGEGKTNLLEAISFLSPGRGLRRAELQAAARRDFRLHVGRRIHVAAA